MKLVIDASLALHACGSRRGLDALEGFELIAPPLMWSETRSVLHRAVWKRLLEERAALDVLEAIGKAPIKMLSPARLGARAWEIANVLGWAKTYDAEYIALAEINKCRLVTADRRMRRGAERLDIVRLLEEL